jgi:hypothetical protein
MVAPEIMFMDNFDLLILYDGIICSQIDCYNLVKDFIQNKLN